MFGNLSRKIGAGVIVLSTAFSGAAYAGSDNARNITLESYDGTLFLVGQLDEVKNGYYLIDVEGLGVLSVDAAKVVCNGNACPTKG
ncbi:hypothetical protein [Profundibacter sp.]